jgi:hypothetical protein
LNSKSNLFPDGLANSSGLVARNFMLHPFGFTEGVFEERIDSYDGRSVFPHSASSFYRRMRAAASCVDNLLSPERSFGRSITPGSFSGHRSSVPIITK